MTHNLVLKSQRLYPLFNLYLFLCSLLGEPNNPQETCAAFAYGGWHDNLCSERRAIVCQHHKIVSEGMIIMKNLKSIKGKWLQTTFNTNYSLVPKVFAGKWLPLSKSCRPSDKKKRVLLIKTLKNLPFNYL